MAIIESSALARLGWDLALQSAFDATAPADTVPARVTRTAARILTVAGDAGTWDVTLHGRLFLDPPPGGVTTGDWVAVDDAGAHAVLPRRSALIRRAAGRVTVPQAMAANVDLVFIAVPLGVEVGARRLERSLAIAWSSGAVPVVLLTKADLSTELPADVTAAMAVAAGATVIAVSAHGIGIDDLRRALPPGSTGAIIGPSGAGKSTLINTLVGDAELATAAVRGDGRGRHTTARRELVMLPGGSMLIDTPGMREMAVWDAREGIDSVFADVHELAATCGFSDCRHEQEPGCAVRQAAVDDPALLDRLESLRKLEREQRHQELMSDARLRADSRREIKRVMRERRRRG